MKAAPSRSIFSTGISGLLLAGMRPILFGRDTTAITAIQVMQRYLMKKTLVPKAGLSTLHRTGGQFLLSKLLMRYTQSLIFVTVARDAVVISHRCFQRQCQLQGPRCPPLNETRVLMGAELSHHVLVVKVLVFIQILAAFLACLVVVRTRLCLFPSANVRLGIVGMDRNALSKELLPQCNFQLLLPRFKIQPPTLRVESRLCF
jgi:hypothetical protein